jgi:cytochrome c oxidase assembly protein subunit 11
MLLVAIGMFGFGYALVPLYDVFCDITGLNGKTGSVDAEQAGNMIIDESRWVNVEFISSVNSELNWQFKPQVTSVKVRPGALNDAIFTAKNNTNHSLTGQAVPSVAPGQAAKYFNKTECFCFTKQELKAGESKEMPLKFIVDRDLPKGIRTITLSYTFFPVEGESVVKEVPAIAGHTGS